MASKFVFTNFAITTLRDEVASTANEFQFNVDDVPRFPVLVGGAKFPIVLADDDDNVEVCYVVNLSGSGAATVERGQEGTLAHNWLAGTIIRHTLTASSVIGAAGFRPRGVWSSSLTYDPGDVVEQTEVSYIAVNTNINSVPTSGSTDWMTVYKPPGAASTALNYQGFWSSTTTYTQGMVVQLRGRLWQANATSLNSAPAVGNSNWTHLTLWSGSGKFVPVLVFTGTNNYSVSIAGSEAPEILYDGLTIRGRFANSNTANATLTINALAATPIRLQSGVEVPTNGLAAGEIYEFTFSSAANEFIALKAPDVARRLTALEGALVGNSFAIGMIMDYITGGAPAGWLVCNGQLVSRTTYSALFALIGTTYNAGNGSTTFGVPDLRGLVLAGSDVMGATAKGRLTGFDVGTVGGTQSVALTVAQMPTHDHGYTDPGHIHPITEPSGGIGHHHTQTQYTANLSASFGPGSGQAVTSITAVNANTGDSVTGITIGNAQIGISIGTNGGGLTHTNIQPTMGVTKIIRAL